MFTLEQIQAAHAKIKSGSDFPKYVQELIALGVTLYDTFVIDGHAVFYGWDGQILKSEAKYPNINISEDAHPNKFAKYLKSHQQGETDYLLFCGHAAESGVWKWTVDTAQMTCTYTDTSGNNVLSEDIPS